jgi:PKD repeat protein
VVVSGSGAGPIDVIWNSGGNKHPSLLVSDNGCVSNISQKNINIIPSSVNISALGPTSFCDGGSVILTAMSANMTYQWYKDQQLINNATQAFYTATQSGNYFILAHDTITGCNSISNQVNVTNNTTDFNLAFIANPNSFTAAPFTTNIVNQTPNKTNYYWVWEFGDGNTSSLLDPAHTYAFNGTYDVRVIAKDVNTGCYDTLVKPGYITCSGGASNPCTINAAITPAGYATICQGDSITLTATAGAGYTYQWIRNNFLIAGADSMVYVAKTAGNYQVIISDSNCTQTSPPLVLANYPSIQPAILSSGTLQACSNDSMLLSVNVGYSSYNWNTGDTTPSIYIHNTGYYQVSVTDNYGCSLTSPQFAVSNSYLNPPEICIVTVDSNDHNVIVWERPNTTLIDSFYIYREGIYAGIYDKIGVVPYSATSVFIDTNSQPGARSYRYRLAAVDTCGGVSLQGQFHKTMHLTINAGLNGAWNLIWEPYQGLQYSSFRIYRGTTVNNMTMIAQLPGTNTTFTDMYPPPGNLIYQTEVLSPTPCYPDSIYKGKTNYLTSRSNHARNNGIPPMYLTANFSANTQKGTWPIQISFTDLSTGNPDSWLWNFGDGNTSIEQNPKHTYNNTGNYTVQLIACNGSVCDTVIRQNFIEVTPNGLVELSANIEAEFYPNPNDGRFTLHIISARHERMLLQIFNSIGNQVYTENLNINGDYSKELDLQHLAKGVYFLRLQSKDQMIMMRKVVIQ